MYKLFNKIFCFFLFCLLTNSSYANISVPFELINGLIIVEAEINGTAGNYIIDSGSNGILLNGSIEASEVSFQTLNSILEGSETKIESFKVGDFEVSELQGFSTDLSNLEIYLDRSIAGILGCSIFTPNSITFDFTNSKLIISEQDSQSFDLNNFKNLSFEVVEDLPITELNIGGETYAFILDSGASSHFIDAELLESHQSVIEATGVEKNIITAGGSHQKALEYKIPDSQIGSSRLILDAFEKDFASISETMDRKISGLLSLSKLSTGIVHFDLRAKKLFYN